MCSQLFRYQKEVNQRQWEVTFAYIRIQCIFYKIEILEPHVSQYFKKKKKLDNDLKKCGAQI